MSDLSAVVGQLKKERGNAQQLVGRLDAALRALKHLGTGNPSLGAGEDCRSRPGGKSPLPKEPDGQK